MRYFRLRLLGCLLLGIVLISAASTYFEVLGHRYTMRSDLARQTQWFAAGIQPQIEQQLQTGGSVDLTSLLRGLRQHRDEPSLVVVDTKGKLLATAGDAPPPYNLPDELLSQTEAAGRETGGFVRIHDTRTAAGSNGSQTQVWYEDAMPLHVQGRVSGALLLMANADYIHSEAIGVWQRNFLRTLATVILVLAVTLLMVRWFLQKPVARAADWLRRLRRGEADVDEGEDALRDLMLAEEVNSLAGDFTHARAAAETEARLRDQGEHVWTAERLAVHMRDELGDGRLFVVSNCEPFMHIRRKGRTECVVPPSGLVTALEPILQACGGTWIAHGSGNNDAACVDEHDRLSMPPGTEKYTLRRVWLNTEEEIGHCEGFSNEGLWPLCHTAHTRPVFRESDWRQYQRVNEKFATVVLEEIEGTENPVVWVQDYHFALLPKMIKDARPDARVAIFWHIPWPNAEAFSICPWQAELVSGMLGADVIGFQLQSYCNNFLATVDSAVEARMDWEQSRVRHGGHVSAVRAYPIGVAWGETEDAEQKAEDLIANEPEGNEPAADEVNAGVPELHFTEIPPRKMGRLVVMEKNRAWNPDPVRRALGIEGKLLLGVDRMDYTKGIVERLLAIEHLLQEHPWFLGQFTFVQIASSSRTGIPSYRDLHIEVEDTVGRINETFQSARWKPVILIQHQFSHSELRHYYQAADVCLVTSLHDGMNLVAKEYVAARNDGDGVLVLSRFAGAAQELTEALQVNPYDIAQVSDAIERALAMDAEERSLRMKSMRLQVKEHNVYRWALSILSDVCAEHRAYERATLHRMAS